MPSNPSDIGLGSTITFDSGFCARITDISLGGISRGSIDTTHMGSTPGNGTSTFGGKSSIPEGLSDPGELTVELHFNPDTPPPIDKDPETCTINWAGGATWAGTAYLTGYEPKAPVNGLMTATAKIKFSGLITITPAA